MRCDFSTVVLATVTLLSISAEARPQAPHHVHGHLHRSGLKTEATSQDADLVGDVNLERRQWPTWKWTNPFYPHNVQTTTHKSTTAKHTTKHSTTSSKPTTTSSKHTTTTVHSTSHTTSTYAVSSTKSSTKQTSALGTSTVESGVGAFGPHTTSSSSTSKLTSGFSLYSPHSTTTSSTHLASVYTPPASVLSYPFSTNATTLKTSSKATSLTTSKAASLTSSTATSTNSTTSKTASKTTTSKTTTSKATTSKATTSKSTTTKTTTTSSTTSAANTANPSVIRGVNIGNWLVLEKWMDSSLFANTDAVDQWTFDGTTGANALLQNHWNTWFTEADVAKIASWGLNAMRIPIGYWAYNNTGTPYLQGADAYLEQALGWARSNGLKVLIDLHGTPGSQNGFDNSGHAGTVAWQTGDNMALTTEVLVQIATKYGTTAWADVVYGIELANEPISWDANKLSVTQAWTVTTYAAIKAVATNKDLQIIMHDGFMGASNWAGVNTKLNANSAMASSKFTLDLHLYQNQVAADSLLTQAQHIQKACNWSTTELSPSNAQNMPIIVGEFSAATNICANPDGSTTAGLTCTVSGCQCASNVPVNQWNQPLVQATRMFVEAQLETFETYGSGWFMWSYKAPGGWGLDNAVQYGMIGVPVTERKYPNICSSSESYY